METADVQKDVAMFGSKYPREALDYYPTIDADCLGVLLPWFCILFREPERVWECAAGDGRLLDQLKPLFPNAYGTDLAPKRDDIGVADFLAPFPSKWDAPAAIVTNPPYVLGDDFVVQAERAAAMYGVNSFFLMRNEFDCAGQSPRSAVFAGRFYRGKHVLRWRPRWVEGSTGSPRHNYAWYHFGPARSAYEVEPYIRYLNRPAKRNDRNSNEGLSIPAHAE